MHFKKWSSQQTIVITCLRFAKLTLVEVLIIVAIILNLNEINYFKLILLTLQENRQDLFFIGRVYLSVK